MSLVRSCSGFESYRTRISRKKYKEIRIAWKGYLDCLCSYPQGEDSHLQNQLPVWNEKKGDLLAKMLIEMGKSLGYCFDDVDIKKGIYLPLGHTVLEKELAVIRQRLIQILSGDSTLKMDINSFPVDAKALDDQKSLTIELLKALQERTGIPISILGRDNHDRPTA